jgi:unsaturated rhamnogalacturonyl hydrolase
MTMIRMRPGILQCLWMAAAAMSIAGSAAAQTHRSPEQFARSIADRIIRETVWDVSAVPWKQIPKLEIVRFNDVPHDGRSVLYAASRIAVDRDTILRFGISRDCPLRIWIGNALVYSGEKPQTSHFAETGYEQYSCADSLWITLRRGENSVLLKASPGKTKNSVYLCEITRPGTDPAARFSAPVAGNEGVHWVICGPFGVRDRKPLTTVYPPESGWAAGYPSAEGWKIWNFAPVPIVPDIGKDARAAYSKESPLEWTYANGTVLLSLLSLSDVAQDTSYLNYTRRAAEFSLKLKPLVRYSYEQLDALRVTDYRMIRSSMTDDTGGPALPYADLWLRTRNDRYQELVSEPAEHIRRRQSRLPDGIICRPEPRAMTVWADDLFMSVPLLLRMGNITGAAGYFDDAAHQIIGFHKILQDTITGLYRHGCYVYERKQSPFCWGRANGWVIWAESEALLHLPRLHPSYDSVLRIFRHHMMRLKQYQAQDGLFHQILDKPESFEETSCSAMFLIGALRGLRTGVLDSSFSVFAEKLWEGLQKNVSDGGIVTDICRGTELSERYDYYASRERPANDPRGIGAVITAASEMVLYNRQRGR